MDRDTNSWYVQVSGQKDGADVDTTYYYCNRSGHFKSKSTGQRRIKSQGTSKINAHCTACLIVSKDKINQCLRVLVHKTHYGHNTALGHLRIPNSARLALASQIMQGIDFQHILDNIRDSLGQHFHRIHLLTRKDISNIEKSYGLRGAQRHKDDATGVNIWVEEMQASGANPIILYKKQGEPQPENCDNVSDKDFILAIQTPLQAEMMRKLANNRVICVDGTHGTNSYDFTLITMVVIDEYGEGYPVAWCISNREDKFLVMNFFNAIKKKVGILHPKWFMTDLAEQFYNAWVSTFDNKPQKLVCTWHVDRAWREKLKQLKNRELEATLSHNLRVLLEETDTTKFEELLHQTLKEFNESKDTVDFGNYFKTHYAKTKEQWAGCYRRDVCKNTNMYVEAFIGY